MESNRPTPLQADEEKQTKKALNFITKKVIPKIPRDIRPFFRLKYCRGTNIDKKTLEALIEAILVFSAQVNVSKKCTIFIGSSSFRFNIGLCGSFLYEQKPECMATTIIDHNIVFLDIHTLSRLKQPERCVAYILEEFVHAFLDVPGHPLANNIVCLLYPKVKLNHREEYQAH